RSKRPTSSASPRSCSREADAATATGIRADVRNPVGVRDVNPTRSDQARRAMEVLTGATLIDGTGASPIPDAVVVIDGERIAAAGARAHVRVPARAEVVDLDGLTLLPGLIDTHDHLASHGYALTTRWGLDEPASTAHLRTGSVLARTVGMGYTTVRD